MKLILVLLAAISFSATSYADQCSWNSRYMSQTALPILANQDFIYYFCEPCGHTDVYEIVAAGLPNSNTLHKRDITFKDTGVEMSNDPEDSRSYYQFVVNGRTEGQQTIHLDLAYTYINIPNFEDADSRDMTLVNVGAILNCRQDGVTVAPPMGTTNIIPWDPGQVDCGTDGCG